jgi:hypothetical protein
VVNLHAKMSKQDKDRMAKGLQKTRTWMGYSSEAMDKVKKVLEDEGFEPKISKNEMGLHKITW